MTRKRLALIIGGLAVSLGVVLFGVGWYYSLQIEDGALRVKHDPLKYEVEVVELEKDRVKLKFPTEEDLRKQPENTGIEWPDGYARVGETLDVDGAEVQLFGCSAVSDVSAAPGTVVISEEGILIAAGGGGILVRKVRPHGESKMDAREFLSGSNAKDGTQLGG